MNKKALIVGLLAVLLALFLLTSCKPKTPDTGPVLLFNESINEDLEKLTDIEPGAFEGFMFEYELRNDSKYEMAEDDIFSIADFTSEEVSFFGVMLGDSYEQVLERLGIPDVMFIPADESYKNLDYRNKIGIGGTLSGISFHLEEDVVTRITVKPSFNKYLHGNTSIGVDKEIIYIVMDVPDYQSFIANLRVFHYIEKGVEIYFKNRYVDRISFVPSKEFKGVEYVSKEKLAAEGIVVNITEPVLIE